MMLMTAYDVHLKLARVIARYAQRILTVFTLMHQAPHTRSWAVHKHLNMYAGLDLVTLAVGGH